MNDKRRNSEMLLIVWHSRTGASEALARAAHGEARLRQNRTAEGSSILLACDEVSPRTILEASAYLFVCPENLATMSGAMKEMFDRCYYPVLGRVEGRGYGTIIAAGSDGAGAERQIDRICIGWRLKRVAPSLIVSTNAQTAEAILAPKTLSRCQLDQARDMGKAMRQGLSLGLF